MKTIDVLNRVYSLLLVLTSLRHHLTTVLISNFLQPEILAPKHESKFSADLKYV